MTRVPPVSKSNVLSREEMVRLYGDLFSMSPMVEFDESVVPESLRSLAHYAKFWGVSDDWARDDLVLKASEEVQRNLKLVVELHEDEFDDWLAGPEASSESPSDAYVAFSFMRIAADYSGEIIKSSE